MESGQEEIETGETAPEEPLEGSAQGEEDGVPLARLSDRFLAYCLDAFLFLIPSRLILHAALEPRPSSLVVFKYQLAWVAAYTLYCAFLNAGGRATLGKKLLGLQVVTPEGEALSYGRSLLRALGYIPSGALLELGFLWAATNPLRRTWHDYLAGSVVVESGERPAWVRGLCGVLAPVLLAVLLFMTVRSLAVRPAPPDLMQARQGLDYVAGLEAEYRARNGRYTESVKDLAALAGGPRAFRDRLSRYLRTDGFGLKADKNSCLIVAVAQDGTEVKKKIP